jgi:hypothetical protein
LHLVTDGLDLLFERADLLQHLGQFLLEARDLGLVMLGSVPEGLFLFERRGMRKLVAIGLGPAAAIADRLAQLERLVVCLGELALEVVQLGAQFRVGPVANPALGLEYLRSA